MSNDDTYNGYANRETWAAALHLSNDEGLYHLALDTAETALREAQNAHPDMRGSDAQVIGVALEQLVGELTDENGDYGWNDTLRMMRDEIGSQWRVDWTEVGAGFIPSEHGR